MNRRKLLLLGLLLTLPVAVIVPMRALRLWQPRELKLPRDGKIAARADEMSGLFWRDSGLLVVRAQSRGWSAPIALTNWDGQSVPVRALRATSASLDGSGSLASATYHWDEAMRLELHEIGAARGQNAKASGRGAMHLIERRPQEPLSDCSLSPDGEMLACSNATTAFDNDLYPRPLSQAMASKLWPLWNGVATVTQARTGQRISRLTMPPHAGKTSKKVVLRTLSTRSPGRPMAARWLSWASTAFA